MKGTLSILAVTAGFVTAGLLASCSDEPSASPA